MRLWNGAAIYFDPEIAGGEGLGGVAGIAGFPNGEIPRVGTPEPEPYVARLYIQQVFGLGGDREHVDSDVNQIAGYRDINRFTLTVGKFGAVDFFDANTYSHDPRSQFMNWAIMDTGSWDYPADTRGYTYGVAMEINHPDWAFRYGAFGESTTANGGEISGDVLKSEANVFELEERYKIHDHAGTVRLMAWENNAHMGNYAEAISHPGPHGPNVARTRAWTVKYGFGISGEQSLSDNLGIFLRGGWDDGHTESWAFTEIDRTIALGLSLKGGSWGRPTTSWAPRSSSTACPGTTATISPPAATASSSATAASTTLWKRSARPTTSSGFPTTSSSPPTSSSWTTPPTTVTAAPCSSSA